MKVFRIVEISYFQMDLNKELAQWCKELDSDPNGQERVRRSPVLLKRTFYIYDVNIIVILYCNRVCCEV